MIKTIIGSVFIILFSTSVFADDIRFEQTQKIRDLIQSKFLYIYQPSETDHFVFHTGETPFFGDCDDFAVAAYYQMWKIGYKPKMYLLQTPNDGLHTIACGNGYCIDSGLPLTYPEVYLTQIGYTVIQSGELPPEIIQRYFK